MSSDYEMRVQILIKKSGKKKMRQVANYQTLIADFVTNLVSA